MLKYWLSMKERIPFLYCLTHNECIWSFCLKKEEEEKRLNRNPIIAPFYFFYSPIHLLKLKEAKITNLGLANV